MLKKTIKYSLPVFLIFHGTAFAQVTEQMKSTVKEMIQQTEKVHTETLLRELHSHQVITLRDFPNPEQTVFEEALKKYPELDNDTDRSDLKKFISEARREALAVATAKDQISQVSCVSGNSVLSADVSSIRSIVKPGGKSSESGMGPINGSWKFHSENAVFTIEGDTGKFTTSYGGCTEIWPMSLTYPEAGKVVLKSAGSLIATPSGCTGGSPPFPPNAELEFARNGNDVTFTWNEHTYSGGIHLHTHSAFLQE